jgi:hypothetical protein
VLTPTAELASQVRFLFNAFQKKKHLLKDVELPLEPCVVISGPSQLPVDIKIWGSV